MELMEEENREEDVLELDGKPVLTAPPAPAERDDGGRELPAVPPAPRDQSAGAEKTPLPAEMRGDRPPEAEADWRKPAADAARASQTRAARERARRRDMAEAPGRESGGARASVFWPEKVELALRQDAADRGWAGARAGWRGGSLPGAVNRLPGGGADGSGRSGTDRPGFAPSPAGEAGDADMAGPEGAARFGGLDRDMAGLEALYRQTAQAVRPETPLLGGGARTVVRVEEAAPAAALTVEELDRAVRRDSRRYDGEMSIF